MTTNAKNLVSELLPCPWCGSVAYTENQFGKEYWVQCSIGHSDGILYETLGDAEDAWNTRAQPAQAGDAVGEPVAWRITTEVINEDMRPAGKKTFVTDDGKHAYLHATNNAAVTPLYTAPHNDGKVARDAERYRFLRECKSDAYYVMAFDPEGDAPCIGGEIMDNAIDAAIKEQRSLSRSNGSSGGEK